MADEIDGQEVDEMNIATDAICIQLRKDTSAAALAEDRWPLATFSGGIEKIQIRRRGNTTTIKIKSPEASVWCDDVHRPPQRGLRSAGALKAKPA